MEHIHEGILYQDHHKRYCVYESGISEYKRLTCTSGCRLEVWLNRAWIAGYVEGDGEDYWLFADGGGRFLLAEHMKARYTEHHWRSGIRDISGICSSPSIRISVEIRKINSTNNNPNMCYSWKGENISCRPKKSFDCQRSTVVETKNALSVY